MSDDKVYDPQGLAKELFQKRYALHKDEIYTDMCLRVANHVAEAESPENVIAARSDFTDILVSNLFMPGGRILYSAGRRKANALNCFLIPTSDSREGWGKSVSDMIIIGGMGGGVGVNFSPIRPRGTPISGTGGQATGAVSLMEIINTAGEVIKAGGGRRTALMFALNLNHGDLPEFLDKKLDLKQLNNANVSVFMSEDPTVFFDKVKKDEQFDLKFRGKVVKTIKAKQIWDQILSNALKGGEPGIINGYLANKTWNLHYYKPILGTNPCGEIPLIENSACCLGSIVLPRFVAMGKKGGTVDWEELARVVKIAVRFLDDVITINNYPLPEIAETCNQIRQLGLGIMGLHDMILMLGMKYASDEALEFVDKLLCFIKDAAYNASIDLAIEKGEFPRFEAEAFLKSGFAKTLKPSIRSRIRKHGIRNCALLTIAPTGTTSMVCNVTSGIEPMFAPAYLRRFRDSDTSDSYRQEVVVHPLLRQFIQEGRSIEHFQGAYDLSMRDHLEMQRVCQKHLDNACSKTIQVPQGTSQEQLSDLLMEFLPDLKGVTVYPEGSRENQPLTPLSMEDALRYIKENSEITSEATSKDSCRGGQCDI